MCVLEEDPLCFRFRGNTFDRFDLFRELIVSLSMLVVVVDFNIFIKSQVVAKCMAVWQYYFFSSTTYVGSLR